MERFDERQVIRLSAYLEWYDSMLPYLIILSPALNDFTYSSSSHSNFASINIFAIFLADVWRARTGPCISWRMAPASLSPGYDEEEEEKEGEGGEGREGEDGEQSA